MVQKLWSKFWKASTQTRKQRKYVHNAPLHVKHKMMNAALSKDLKTEYGINSVPVRSGDTVKVMRGSHRGMNGKVTKVSLAKTSVFVEEVGVSRADGTKALRPVHPSNVQIIKFDSSDKKRMEKIERIRGKN